MGDSSVVGEGMAAPTKLESAAVAEGTPSDIESTPEHEAEPGASAEQPIPPVKRKGGRKPIYATSEERKQRNRQAQAAFRERRTEYIKQLEATIKQNEDALANLQQSHRTAADECLMLRYKNSLLERILLEKGIDVQAELQMKTGSPILGPGVVPPGVNIAQQSRQTQAPLQRAAVQQQHARRSGQGFLPKLAPGHANTESGFPQSSPGGHPTPSSHASSPTNVPTRSPLTMHQGGITPPTSAALAQGQAQQYHTYPRPSQQLPNPGFFQPHQSQQPINVQRSMQRPAPPSQYQSSASTVSSQSVNSVHNLNPPTSAGGPSSAGPSSASTYYPSPFQKHIDQLEHEYDTQHTQAMLDQPDHRDADRASEASPTQLQGTYPPQFEHAQHAPQHQQQQDYYQPQYAPPRPMVPQQQYEHQPSQQMMPTSQPQAASGGSGSFAMGQVIDPSDPMLDADPFGLSASMHYPTTYSAMDQQPHR